MSPHNDGAINLAKLWAAEEKERRARAEYERASVSLNVASSERRHAELHSQACAYWDEKRFAALFGSLNDRERDIALAAANYVLFGRSA